jgi:hypothetical protein
MIDQTPTPLPDAVALPETPDAGGTAGMVVTPITARVYQITRGDSVLGFAESSGTQWLLLAGPSPIRSTQLGAFPTLSAGLRALAA